MSDSGCELGAGLGLRIPHIQQVLREQPDVPWFEVHICNFLRGGLNRKLLELIAARYPLSFHSVSLNIGGVDPLNQDYLRQLKQAVDEFNPLLVSDHACFTMLDGLYQHDLLPIPYTLESVKHCAARIDQIQNTLGRVLLVENVSRYAEFAESDMNEAQFLAELSTQSGCEILLDLNNTYVNQCNLGEDMHEFVATLPKDKVSEIHLAGHSIQFDQRVDTHSAPVCDEVWESYAIYSQYFPQVPCLIEWDNDLPDFNRLQQERDKAQALLDRQTHNVKHNHAACIAQ